MVLKEVATALAYMHSNEITHNDMKCAKLRNTLNWIGGCQHHVAAGFCWIMLGSFWYVFVVLVVVQLVFVVFVNFFVGQPTLRKLCQDCAGRRTFSSTAMAVAWFPKLSQQTLLG